MDAEDGAGGDREMGGVFAEKAAWICLCCPNVRPALGLIRRDQLSSLRYAHILYEKFGQMKGEFTKFAQSIGYVFEKINYFSSIY